MAPLSDPAQRPNRSGAATRAKIIDAAIDVLAMKGFSGFTLKAVAERAEVFYGNVTHHYATRDKLVEAMIAAILNRYRRRIDTLVTSLRTEESPAPALVTWLIDDSVSPDYAPVFIELWAMASHMPEVAGKMTEFYDTVVESCMRSLGVDPHAEASKPLRDTLFFLGTVVEGSSCIFANRDRATGPYAGVRQRVIAEFVPLIEQHLAEARAAAAAKP